MFIQLSATADIMQDSLWFNGSRVGTHSISSRITMDLYLTRRTITTIMLIGRWDSDEFLLYIRRQVQESSTGFSEDMTRNEIFLTIPELHISSDRNYLRTRNPQSFENTISLNGPSAAKSRKQRPEFHLYH